MLSIFETIPRNSDQFNKLFATEEACTEHFMKWRWPNGFVCPRCPGGPGGYFLKDRGVWQCMKCKYHCSIRAGTMMNASKKSLLAWFRALYYIIEEKDCCSALGLKRRLGLGSNRTAWTWFQKLREQIPEDDEKLYGRVEFDQIFVGGRTIGKQKEITASGLSDKIIVFVAVEVVGKGSGRVRLQIAPTGSAEEVTEFLAKHIKKGTVVRTDGHVTIKGLTELGFYHERIVMSEAKRIGKSTKMERLEANLSRIFRVSRCLDRVLMGTHMGAVAPWRLKGYLDTFAFMFDRKATKARFSIFEDVLRACVSKKCRTYREIIADEKVGVGGYNTKTGKPKGREAPKETDRWWKRVQYPNNWSAPGMEVEWAL